MARDEIRFLLNDREVRCEVVGARDTLLDYLRLSRRLTGTKEGCAEGDCGACTVLVGRRHAGMLRYETVNACIRLLASLDGCHVVTVEHLAGPGGALHPVQQALVDHHGSQCGFCTPGIVMALYALWMETDAPSDTEIETALQGNLCRCTGYAPIMRAAKAAAGLGARDEDALIRARAETLARLDALADHGRVEVRNGDELAILPADADDLAAILETYPDATIVAGATDVGLWVTKAMKDISPAVFIGHLDDLKTIDVGAGALTIGAGVTYSEAEDAIKKMFPHLAELWCRIGGWQVRNMGTIGGNIANGSPIGDTPPVLIALGAEITFRKGDRRRVVPLEAFFIDYGKQDRAPGEFLEQIRIPRPAPGALMAAYKISKRRDEDISSVCGAFTVTVENGIVQDARLAFGGMAATPKRAARAEQTLIGAPWSEAAARQAGAALAEDFSPISDWRASADYRMLAARNLLLRFAYETTAAGGTWRLAANDGA